MPPARLWSGIVRVLLDECVAQQLRNDIIGHDVKTVRDEGWLGISDDELLANADGRHDVIVTVDHKLPRQHDLTIYRFAVVVLRTRHNRYRDLAPLVPLLLAKLPTLVPGAATTISEDDVPAR